MPKYINVDELKTAFINWQEIADNPYDYFPSVEDCHTVIDAQPVADVQEVRHGRWEQKKDPYGFFDTIPVCSVCNCMTKYRETSLYCPNCGAKMEELK